MEEKNLRECKVCKLLKLRILAGKFDDRNKRYNDEYGQAWNGSTCPTCHVMKTRFKMKNLRNGRKNVQES